MYSLMCDMQRQKMRKLNKIIFNLSVEERKTLMETLQRDESSELKSNQYDFFLEFVVILYLRISANMF